MSSKPMEIFPDLHLKMSKKIAQLTKVIYHLNTKNEDHQAEIENQNFNHQAEIQQILKDAASKLGKFKEILESKQASINLEAQLSKLQKKHDLEKQTALQEFQAFKDKMNNREQKSNREFQSKLAEIRTETEKMNSKFQERILNFESVNQELKKSLDAAKRGEELKKKHDEETADLIRKGNEKYQEMLLEQLKVQENLKKEFEKKLIAMKSELMENSRKEMEKELGQIRAQMGGDKQEALMSIKREYELKLQTQRDELTSKLEKAIADIKQKTEQIDILENEKKNIVIELNNKIQELEKILKEKLGGADAQTKNLTMEIMKLNEANNKFRVQIQLKDDEIESLKLLIQQKNDIITDNEITVKSLEDEIYRLTNEIQRLSSNGSNREIELMNKITNNEKEIKSLHNEINQMASNLNTIREELKLANKNYSKLSIDSDKSIGALTMEKEKLYHETIQLKEVIDSNKNKFNRDMIELQNVIASNTNNYNKEKETLVANYEFKTNQLIENHNNEINKLNNLLKDINNNFELMKIHNKNQIQECENNYENKLQQLTNEKDGMIEEVTNKCNKEIVKLKSTLQILESQLNQLQSNGEGEKASLSNEIKGLKENIRNITKELEQKKSEMERSESIINGLKIQVEALREELAATQRANREKLDHLTNQLTKEWNEKFDKIKQNHSLELDRGLNEMKQAQRLEINKLQSIHEEDIRVLKAALQKEADDNSRESSMAERERLALQEELRQLKLDMAGQLSELGARHEKEKKVLDQRRKQEVEALQREAAQAAEAREGVLRMEGEERLSQLKKQHDIESKAFEIKTQLELETLRRRWLEEQGLGMRQLEAKLMADRERILAETEESSRRKLMQTEQEHLTAVKLLQQELATTKEGLLAITASARSVETQLVNERAERQRREERFVIERDQQQREHEDEVRKLTAANVKKVSETLEKGNEEKRLLRLQLTEENQQLQEKLNALQLEYAELQEKWERRDSRPEDVARIEQLEREMVEKDLLVQKTKEEMLYFKREMLNREENYNQKFGRSPNVGIMQVLKTKDTSAPGTTGINAPNGGSGPKQQPFPPSNKPQYSLPNSRSSSLGLDSVGNLPPPLQVASGLGPLKGKITPPGPSKGRYK